jgi:hypothetical protein
MAPRPDRKKKLKISSIKIKNLFLSRQKKLKAGKKVKI